MKKRTVTTLNASAKTRLAAIEMRQGGATLKEVGEAFGVDKTTVRAWVIMYEQGGIEALKTYMKPRPHHVLDVDELEALHKAEPGDEVIASLLDLARGGGLNETAKKWGISPQALAKRRRVYLKTRRPGMDG